MKIGIIGMGHMGKALVCSWKSSQTCNVEDQILAVKRKERPMHPLVDEYLANISELENKADIIILAVKPHQMNTVCSELRGLKTYISIVAGISTQKINTWIGHHTKTRICRVMPNLAVAVNTGIHVIYCDDEEIYHLAKRLFSPSGVVTRVFNEDPSFHIATIMYACLPALMLEFMNEIGQAAIKNFHLDAGSWNVLLPKLLLGLHALLQNEPHGNVNPQELIQGIASKGGITETGLEVMRSNRHFKKMIIEILQRSFERSRTLDKG